jgi:hypothetical protein
MTDTTIANTSRVNNVNPAQEASCHSTLPQEPVLPARPAASGGGPRPEHYQRIDLHGTETTAELRARGVPATTTCNIPRTTAPACLFLSRTRTPLSPRRWGTSCAPTLGRGQPGGL